jgi:dTDP-4-amino-4,6-dideoxygalactose transaminase
MKSGWTRDRICAEIDAKGVPVRIGACPDISREAAFAGLGAQPPHPNAATLADRTIMLPVHPTLTAGNVAFIANATAATIAAAVR